MIFGIAVGEAFIMEWNWAGHIVLDFSAGIYQTIEAGHLCV